MPLYQKVLAAVLLLAGLILLNFISARIPGQIDMTGDGVYSLSKASREILQDTEEPVLLRFYFSRGLEEVPLSLKNYATRVETLLEQYENAANGPIVLQTINPRPDTDEEAQAIREGIEPQTLPGGEVLYFGLSAIQAEAEAVIPFFVSQREPFLEYDISRLIFNVQQLDRPTLGLITQLEMLGSPGNPMMGQAPREGWVFAEELRRSFQIERIRGDRLPENLDLLAIIHPGNLSEELQFEIDQFLLAGKPVFLALDPSSWWQRNVQQRQNQEQRPMMDAFSSDLPTLLTGWGIEYSDQEIVGDLANGLRVAGGPGGQPVAMPVWLELGEAAITDDSPITAQLEQILLLESGRVGLAPESQLGLSPILQSSPKSSTMMPSILQFSSPEQIIDQVNPDNLRETLAARISGTFPTAFPEGPPREQTEAETMFEDLLEAEEGDFLEASADTSTLIFFADTDFLSNPASVEVINFLGSRAYQPVNDNLALATNIAEFLGGSRKLIALRGKGAGPRPFEVIEELRREAELEYREQIEAREARLREVQEQLRELQSQTMESGRLVASPEVQEAIEEFQLQEAELRNELRMIRKQLRERIEAKRFQLAMLNLAPVPLLIAVLGIGYFLARSRRRGK